MEPQNIGRYVVKSRIGKGGMATIFLAHDPMFGRDVAVKVLPREFLHDPPSAAGLSAKPGPLPHWNTPPSCQYMTSAKITGSHIW